MFSLKKTRRTYQKPRINEALVDLEGSLLLPGSQTVNTQWDRLKNVNKEEGDGVGTPLYFE